MPDPVEGGWPPSFRTVPGKRMIERKHILVIESGTSLLGAHLDRLEKNRYQVTVASTPRKALAHVRSTPFSLIVLDKALSPRHTELARLLSRTEAVPKIVVSCDGRFTGIPQWLRQGAAGHIHAPFEYGEFRQLMEQVQERARSEGTLSRVQRELDLLQHELREIRDFGRALGSALRLDDVETIISHRAKSALGAEASLLYLLDQDSGWVLCDKSHGTRKSNAEVLRFRPGEGVAGAVVDQGRPVLVPQVDGHIPYRMTPRQLAFYRGRSVMCVPLKGVGDVLGAVEVVGRKRTPAYSEDDLAFFVRLMDQAPSALDRARSYQRATDMAMADDLTGLFNLRYLTSVIDAEVERGQRYGVVVSVIFMDLDHFKDVNDSKGHLVGSKVLVEVADLLRDCLRSVDVVARYGGDEFVVVLPQTSLDAAFAIAERLRRTMEKSVFLEDEGHAIRLTASFGVTSYPEVAKSKEELLRMADEAMYMAKTRSRNSVYAMRY